MMKVFYFNEKDEEDLAQHIQMLKTQLLLLTQQIQIATEKQARLRKRRKSAGPTGISGLGTPSSKSKKLSKSGEKKIKRKRSSLNSSDDEKMPDTDITYEQKRELSDNINILPPDKLPLVFEIIKESTHLNVNLN